MHLALILMTVALGWSAEDLPAYVLEYPGIAFGDLPAEMADPVEGTLDDSSGVVQSAPNSTGTEYRMLYWQEDLAPSTRKADWLVERLRTVMPPDMVDGLLFGTTEWVEGSMASPFRETSSVGLIPAVNFNIITDNGSISGMGKAAAIFRNGYSVLLYAVTPGGSRIDVRTALDDMISKAYLTSD
jgi:hypothetical protein